MLFLVSACFALEPYTISVLCVATAWLFYSYIVDAFENSKLQQIGNLLHTLKIRTNTLHVLCLRDHAAADDD